MTMSFAELTEERQPVLLLQRSLDRGRLGHAYLFSGVALEELETAARTLAKTLNCQNPPRVGEGKLSLDSCDQCLSCRKIDDGNHPDVTWVRPESKSRVIVLDQVRDLMQTIYLKPAEARYKVAVIVSADRLRVEAANAFLKTLEEPPPRSLIILLSTEPHRILETIVSRCLRLSFSGEQVAQIRGRWGNWVAEFSGMAAKESKSLLGRYRLLGVLLAELARIRAETEKRVEGRSPLQRYDDVDAKLREKWEDELAAAIEAEYRRERADLLLGLHWWLRDVWLKTLGLGGGLLSFPALEAATAAVGARVSPEQAASNLEVIEQLQRLLGSNVQEALALEVGLLKLKL